MAGFNSHSTADGEPLIGLRVGIGRPGHGKTGWCGIREAAAHREASDLSGLTRSLEHEAADVYRVAFDKVRVGLRSEQSYSFGKRALLRRQDEGEIRRLWETLGA